jgi:hypothetical protein
MTGGAELFSDDPSITGPPLWRSQAPVRIAGLNPPFLSVVLISIAKYSASSTRGSRLTSVGVKTLLQARKFAQLLCIYMIEAGLFSFQPIFKKSNLSGKFLKNPNRGSADCQ